MKEMVSVIIPVYKTEQYLDRCIESVVNQTYKNLEIILVDDGSPDNCPKMCDEWAKKDSRIKVIHKKNGGLSDARNVGIDCATGEYLSFIDSDDFISNQMYKKMLNSIENFNADLAVCGIETFYDGQTPDVMVDKEDEVISNKEAFLRLNNKEYNTYLVIACNKLYKNYLMIVKVVLFVLLFRTIDF